MATQISDSARELFNLLDVNRFDHIETKRLVGAAVLDKQAQVAGLAAGLQYQHEGLGAYLVVERAGSKRDELKRHSLYAIASVGSEIEAAEQLARAIAEKHGPGLWWDTGGCVGYCGDDGKARAGMLNGAPHVVLRAYYFHDPVCPLCSKPCTRIEALGTKVSGCECVGDRTMVIGRSMQGFVAQARRIAETTIDPAKFQQVMAQGTRAVALEAVVYAAQIGAITTEHARELLDAPHESLDHTPIVGSNVSIAWRKPHGGVQVWLKSQSEDTSAAAEFRYKTTWSHSPVDPRDVEYDGMPLRCLLALDERGRREWGPLADFTALQKFAISAHWSAELRKRTEASK